MHEMYHSFALIQNSLLGQFCPNMLTALIVPFLWSSISQLSPLHNPVLATRGTFASPLLGSGSVHASLIQGGQELSSYPRHCSLGVERRTVPGETLQKVESEIPRICEQIVATDPTFKATVKTSMVRDPFEVSLDEPIVRAVLREAIAILGHQPGEIGQTGWMDSALLSAAGIPAVVFGPGGEGAHAVVEWSNLEHVERCAEILAAVAEEFCDI